MKTSINFFIFFAIWVFPCAVFANDIISNKTENVIDGELKLSYYSSQIAKSSVYLNTFNSEIFGDLNYDFSSDEIEFDGYINLPCGSFGSMALSNLSLFLYRPFTTYQIFLSNYNRPFRTYNPKYASFSGGTIGTDYGFFYLAPASKLENYSLGFYFSPNNFPLSFITLTNKLSKPNYEDTWYTDNLSLRYGLYGALLARFYGENSFLGLSSALRLGFPGPDSFSFRIESKYNHKKFFCSLISAYSSKDWVSPDGKQYDTLFIAPNIGFKLSPLFLDISCKLITDDFLLWNHNYKLALKFPFLFLILSNEISVNAVSKTSFNFEELELDFTFNPISFQNIGFGSSWLYKNKKSERFQVFLDINFGKAVVFDMELAIRFTEYAKLYKFSTAMTINSKSIAQLSKNGKNNSWKIYAKIGTDSFIDWKDELFDSIVYSIGLDVNY